MAHTYWPPFDISVRTPILEMRLPTDDEIVRLIELAERGVHGDDMQPFSVAWATRPQPELGRGMAQYHWRCRAELRPEAWRLPMAVFADGDVVGMQDVMARDYPTLRTITSGSWVVLERQGQGLGTEMRHAMLHLAFAGLGAAAAHTAAREENRASIRVTEKCGYLPNGEQPFVIGGGEAVRLLEFRMPRDAWEPRRRDDITIEGLTESCLEMLGATR